MTVRQFFGKARRKIIKFLLGKELLNNLVNLKQVHEDIVCSKIMISENIKKIDQALFCMKNDEKLIVGMINRVNAAINIRHDQLYEHIKNEHAVIEGLKKTIDNLTMKVDEQRQKIDVLDKRTRTIGNVQIFMAALENCEWIKDKSFAPGGWAMDSAALYTLFRILAAMKPLNILEFGLGQSSKLLYQYATFFDNVRAVTIEHDRDWVKHFESDLSKDVNVNVKIFEKTLVNYKGFETLIYNNIGELTAGEKYDFVIVDGPYGSERYSRSQIIDIAKSNLCDRFCIFMDDTNRGGEKDTINEVCAVLDAMEVKYSTRDYIGEKCHHVVICSDNLKFLASLW